MAVLLYTLAFALVSFASPLVPQLIHPLYPAGASSSTLRPSTDRLPNVRINSSTSSASNRNGGPGPQLVPSSESALNASALGRGNIACRGPGPGAFLVSAEQCLDALHSVPESPDLFTHEVTFGPREALIYHVGLPRRYLSTDGRCEVQLFLKANAHSARAAPQDVINAASNVISSCIGRGPTLGGVAYNFGGNNNLVISIEVFPHNRVRCEGRVGGPGIIESCDRLANTMKTSRNPNQIFGIAAFSTVHTPYTEDDRDSDRCRLKIYIDTDRALTQVSNWETVWLAVIAINAQCIRRGFLGSWVDLGARPDSGGALQVIIQDRQGHGELISNLTTS